MAVALPTDVGSVVHAIFQGLAAGSTTRHVVAAAAAAVVRIAMFGWSELEDTEAVLVPCEVAGLVKPVAAAMEVQKVIGDMLGSPLHNAGLAYEALRHLNPEVAAQVRALNRASNIAKHGSQRDGRKA